MAPEVATEPTADTASQDISDVEGRWTDRTLESWLSILDW